jgi:SAM-dependent methyltransferase
MNAVIEAARPDLAAIKQKQQATWASGDFAVVGTTLQIVGESLARSRGHPRRRGVSSTSPAGNGNATLAAARRFAQVTSTDYVPALLDKGRERARAEGLPVQFEAADVENLPFADGSFDVVLSTYGCMFAPDHARTASEMMRVLRPGRPHRACRTGRRPGSSGGLFKVIGAHLPPPAGLQSPALVGPPRRTCSRRCSRRRPTLRAIALLQLPLSHGSPPGCQVFRDYYGRRTRPSRHSTPRARRRSRPTSVALLTELKVGGAEVRSSCRGEYPRGRHREGVG